MRRRDLLAADLVTTRYLRLTAAPLTVLGTAVTVPDGSASLDRALQKRVRFSTVYRAFCRNTGRRGASAAGHLLRAAADRADSAAERLLALELLVVPGATVLVGTTIGGRYRVVPPVLRIVMGSALGLVPALSVRLLGPVDPD